MIQKSDNFYQDKLLGKINCFSCSSLVHHKMLNRNVLLPNGDVALCCMDYSLRHIFGNLLVSDYQDLFRSIEYHKLQKGLDDDSANIICRHCENAVPRFAFFKNKLRSEISVFKKKLQHLLVHTSIA